jgi:hypothetical protein
MVRRGLGGWLRLPVLSGWQALLCGLVAFGLPTLIRIVVNGEVTGCEFTPYLPFVLISAILLRWWQAGIVALASVAIMGGLFDGALLAMPCFKPAAAIFLASAAAIIGVAVLLRRIVEGLQARDSGQPSGGIIFSLEKGEVWASWYGDARPVRLGTERKVSTMMADFLAQVELGKRLTHKD